MTDLKQEGNSDTCCKEKPEDTMLSERSQTHGSDSTQHPEHSGHTAGESGSCQERQRQGRQGATVHHVWRFRGRQEHAGMNNTTVLMYSVSLLKSIKTVNFVT